jgi:hypothetical protein
MAGGLAMSGVPWAVIAAVAGLLLGLVLLLLGRGLHRLLGLGGGRTLAPTTGSHNHWNRNVR